MRGRICHAIEEERQGEDFSQNTSSWEEKEKQEKYLRSQVQGLGWIEYGGGETGEVRKGAQPKVLHRAVGPSVPCCRVQLLFTLYRELGMDPTSVNHCLIDLVGLGLVIVPLYRSNAAGQYGRAAGFDPSLAVLPIDSLGGKTEIRSSIEIILWVVDALRPEERLRYNSALGVRHLYGPIASSSESNFVISCRVLK
ncbi:hypothetical protein BHE74_00028026 [Ensete ventricosum]|nr:hypothetical protein BHE74_00028026 [Ensete ventricosum]